MSVIDQQAVYWRESTWLRFDGTVEKRGSKALLRARVDPRCFALVDGDMVRESSHGEVEVQRGADVLDFFIPADSVFATPSQGVHRGCDNGSTRCYGRIEICCEGSRIVDSCKGQWGCG